MRARNFVLSTMLVVSWTPAAAHAQTAEAQPRWLASPYLHVNGGEVEIRRGGPGGSVAYLGPRLGFELDVDRHHHIFKDKKLDSPTTASPARSVLAWTSTRTRGSSWATSWRAFPPRRRQGGVRTPPQGWA